MSNSADDIIISTRHGKIKGQPSTTIYDDTYYSFERVPYAQPPLGPLRFHAPQPLSSWSGILDCTQKAEKPLQKNPLTNEIEGSEDCLYLNIYVKELKTTKPLPVMIFIYGGGFEKGDASRDLHAADYFMAKPVILITIAYRLGALGFLSMHDPKLQVPGNAGLRDQLMALQWIKQNISHFNGDANNVTLFGESAGAASVHYMMLTAHAKDLFHKAILMSGTVLCPWAVSPVKNLEYRLAQANGYAGVLEDESAIFSYLKELTGAQLVSPYLLTKEENLDDCIFAFGPRVEPYNSENCIIPSDPVDLLATAWGNEIPIMLGGTSFEGLIMYARVHAAPFLLSALQANPEHMLPLALKQKTTLERQKQLAATIKHAHFGENDIDMQHVLSYCDYASYKVFWHPILRTVKARLKHASADTFLYRFDYDSPDFNHQRVKYCGKSMRGVAHVDDLSYLFFGKFSWKLNLNSGEYRTIQRMIDMWTAFAEKSNPNCEQITSKSGAWKPLNNDGWQTEQEKCLRSLECLNIGDEVSLITLPEMKKLLLWETLYVDL